MSLKKAIALAMANALRLVGDNRLPDGTIPINRRTRTAAGSRQFDAARINAAVAKRNRKNAARAALAART
jgi:hypothetical protein